MRPHDVEAALCAWVRPRLGGVHVSTDIPNPRPAAHVRITRTGGSPDLPTPRDPAVVLVESWAPSRAEAFDRAAAIFGMLDRLESSWIADGVWCYDTDPSVPVHYPDPTSKSHRAQFVAVVAVDLAD